MLMRQVVQAPREGWQQGAVKPCKETPRTRFEKDVTIGLYLGWGFLLFFFALWIWA
jgi:hypothetical protein